MARTAVTLAQIARRTGVHSSTVSRALNERTRHLVADDVAARIVATADALGYRPNLMAAALRTRRSRAVGVLVDDIADPARLAQVAGIEVSLCEAGYVMMLCATGSDDKRLAATLDMLAGRGSDGAILLDRSPPAAGTEGTPDELPLVTPADIGAPDAAAAALAVDHLVRRGHRAIGFLAGPASATRAGDARCAGYRDAMRHAGLFVTAIEAGADISIEAGAAATAALLARHPDLTALIAADDRLAFGTLAALTAQGRACPRDLSVVGIGDLPMAGLTTPPLTSIALDGDGLGHRAAALLLARLDDGETPPPPPAPRLVERGSTARPRPAV